MRLMLSKQDQFERLVLAITVARRHWAEAIFDGTSCVLTARWDLGQWHLALYSLGDPRWKQCLGKVVLTDLASQDLAALIMTDRYGPGWCHEGEILY